MEISKTINDILETINFNKKISSLSFSESLKLVINKKNKTIKELAIDSELSRSML